MEFKSTFLAWLVRMPLVQRWSLMFCIRKENVAEHCHQTAVIAHMLAVIKNKLYGGNVNADRLCTLAIYHEVSEAKLQDLNSRTKYSTPYFTREFKRLESNAELECVATLPKELREEFSKVIVQDKIDPELKKIVKAADILAAYIKANDELSFSNKEFIHVKAGLEPRIEALCKTMPEVQYFVDNFLDTCFVSVDQLAGLDSSNAVIDDNLANH